jgi:hypothetical protein
LHGASGSFAGEVAVWTTRDATEIVLHGSMARAAAAAAGGASTTTTEAVIELKLKEIGAESLLNSALYFLCVMDSW